MESKEIREIIERLKSEIVSEDKMTALSILNHLAKEILKQELQPKQESLEVNTDLEFKLRNIIKLLNGVDEKGYSIPCKVRTDLENELVKELTKKD